MALKSTHKEIDFGVGDVVAVHQKVMESGKERNQIFEGMVISIKGSGKGKSFVVRRIGSQKIGIERIFPLFAPVVTKVEVIRSGVEGVKKAKLYYTRSKSKREIEQIYARASKKNQPQKDKKTRKKSKKTSKK